MQEQISMCITSVDGKCYDSAIAHVKIKLSDTEGVNSRSLRFAQLSYVGRYCCVNERYKYFTTAVGNGYGERFHTSAIRR